MSRSFCGVYFCLSHDEDRTSLEVEEVEKYTTWCRVGLTWFVLRGRSDTSIFGTRASRGRSGVVVVVVTCPCKPSGKWVCPLEVHGAKPYSHTRMVAHRSIHIRSWYTGTCKIYPRKPKPCQILFTPDHE